MRNNHIVNSGLAVKTLPFVLGISVFIFVGFGYGWIKKLC